VSLREVQKTLNGNFWRKLPRLFIYLFIKKSYTKYDKAKAKKYIVAK